MAFLIYREYDRFEYTILEQKNHILWENLNFGRNTILKQFSQEKTSKKSSIFNAFQDLKIIKNRAFLLVFSRENYLKIVFRPKS